VLIAKTVGLQMFAIPEIPW